MERDGFDFIMEKLAILFFQVINIETEGNFVSIKILYNYKYISICSLMDLLLRNQGFVVCFILCLYNNAYYVSIYLVAQCHAIKTVDLDNQFEFIRI